MDPGADRRGAIPHRDGERRGSADHFCHRAGRSADAGPRGVGEWPVRRGQPAGGAPAGGAGNGSIRQRCPGCIGLLLRDQRRWLAHRRQPGERRFGPGHPRRLDARARPRRATGHGGDQLRIRPGVPGLRHAREPHRGGRHSADQQRRNRGADPAIGARPRRRRKASGWSGRHLFHPGRRRQGEWRDPNHRRRRPRHGALLGARRRPRREPARRRDARRHSGGAVHRYRGQRAAGQFAAAERRSAERLLRQYRGPASVGSGHRCRG